MSTDTLSPAAPCAPCTPRIAYELRFAPLQRAGCAYAFPCDVDGLVQLDGLSERALANYLFARALVGRDLDTPVVQRLA